MTDIILSGRNDLDLPDYLTIRVEEDGAIAFEFDGVLKEFHIRPDQTARLVDTLEELLPWNLKQTKPL